MHGRYIVPIWWYKYRKNLIFLHLQYFQCLLHLLVSCMSNLTKQYYRVLHLNLVELSSRFVVREYNVKEYLPDFQSERRCLMRWIEYVDCETSPCFSPFTNTKNTAIKSSRFLKLREKIYVLINTAFNMIEKIIRASYGMFEDNDLVTPFISISAVYS